MHARTIRPGEETWLDTLGKATSVALIEAARQ
jgi:hypothetical protein